MTQARTSRAAKIAYIVTSGCYSDYGIRKVFANRQAAQQYIDARGLAGGYDGADIEEWTLHEAPPTLVQRWTTTFFVHPDGHLSDFNGRPYDDPPVWHSGSIDEDEVPKRPRASERPADWDGVVRRLGEGCVEVSVSGRTEAAVLKAARDRAHRLQAERAGVA